MEILTKLNWKIKSMVNSYIRAVVLGAAALTLTVCFMGMVGPGNTAEAAHKVDRHFVDSLEGTGYYVDVNTINIQGDMVTADVYVVKALYNTMYCYGTVYNLPEQSYHYTYTKIYQYETKKLTSYTEVPSMTYGYTNVVAGNNMIMAEVLRFCYEWSQGYQNTSNNTDVGEYLD